MITRTLHKKIVRELKEINPDSKEIRRLKLAHVSRRNALTLPEVEDIATLEGYKVVGETKKTLRVTKPKDPLSDLVKRSILNCAIYRSLGSSSDSTVVTTRSQLMREREAIRKWVKELGGDFPTSPTKETDDE